ncbi:MAG: hypothetical protein A2Y62_10465 [Candidatus Fischerbacteria bacterium RBG_13_37_8]|uniref:Uncharacterized protein n=1 Tax=Candidatus Fischerbacteria bacterium RBG_13_37_8 TaxID=1817863 RepID=A0A1F5VNV7_9BACT|nr:MAG: hypothetical protein A2Y62_10465 [Candidatus Fischerbacteria bacterium RBG_13_37_8]
MICNTKTTPASKDELSTMDEEFINLLEPQVLFATLKQYWNDMEPTILCSHLAEAMDFYENFCKWILQNKSLSAHYQKKAREMLRKIEQQRSLLLRVAE